MMRDGRQLVQAVRYFFFPDSRLLDERTMQLDMQREYLKQQKAQTDEIVRSANRPDVLRNLVIAMTRDENG